jgi:uncharacterized membrane protein
MSQTRIEQLEARVASLEVHVNALRQHVFETTGAPQPPQPVAVTKPASKPDAERVQTAFVDRPALNLEAFFGGRLLLGAGVLAFLLGVGFFLKYAFDNGWIGPSGRVAMGLLGGIAMMIAGERLFHAGRRVYGASIAGLGAAILFLSLWAAGSYFHLVPLGVTFAAMIAVTVATMTIAIRRDEQVLAFVALAGALLTPALNAGPSTNLATLFGYLAVINLALLWLPAKRWRELEAVAFAGTALYLLIEMPWNATAWSVDTAVTVTYATIFLAQFSIMPLMRARGKTAAAGDMVMVVCSAGLYYGVLYTQLYTGHRPWLTAASVVLAIVYLGVARWMSGYMRQTTAAAALGFITIGVGVTFTGAAAAMAWSGQAAALLIIGATTNSWVVRAFGYLGYLLAFGQMNAANLTGGALFANERFATLLVTAIGLGLVAYFTRQPFAESNSFERYVPESAEALAHFFTLLALGYELSGAFGNSPLAVSILMLLYAAVLVACGFLTKRLFTRWEGLALFGVLLLKVFLIDLSSLDTIVRIVSFLAVGSVLLVVALAYQRAQVRGSAGP